MPNWDPQLGWISDREPVFYRDYRDRIASASAGEEQTLAALQARTQAEGQRQLGQQYGSAIGLGYGAAQGGGPAALRGATYGAGAMGQQRSNDAAMMKAIQDQAFRQAYADLLQRRAGYELGAQGLATKGYGMGQERLASGMEHAAQEDASDAQKQASQVGMGISTGAAVGGAAARMSGKSYKEGVSDGKAEVEDQALAKLRARDPDWAKPPPQYWSPAPAAPAAAPSGVLQAGAGAAASAGEAREPSRWPGTFWADFRRGLERMSDPRFKQAIAPARPGAEDATAAELGLQLDVENAKTMQKLRAGGPARTPEMAPMRPEEFDQALASSDGKTYRYTDEARRQYPQQTRGGELYGPMADDLRETRVGRSMLTPDQKGIDIPSATVGTLGLVGRLHDRLAAVESALGAEDEKTRRRLAEGGPVRTGGY